MGGSVMGGSTVVPSQEGNSAHSQDPFPGRIPRLHSQVPFPGSIPRLHSQAPFPGPIPRFHSPALIKLQSGRFLADEMFLSLINFRQYSIMGKNLNVQL